jgi:hypothetical protein
MLHSLNNRTLSNLKEVNEMAQKYESLEMEVIAFDVEDVITTSGEEIPGIETD